MSIVTSSNSALAIAAGNVHGNLLNSKLSVGRFDLWPVGQTLEPPCHVTLLVCHSLPHHLLHHYQHPLDRKPWGYTDTHTATIQSRYICRPYDMLCYKLTILGVKIILSDSNIMKLGIIQSTIESSMFIFVFVWTPILTSVSDADYLRYVHLLSYTYFVGSEWNSTWFNILYIYDLYNAGVILVQEPNNKWQQDSRWHSFESKQTLPLLSHHCWPLCRSEWGLSIPETVVFHSFHHSWNVSWDVFPSYGHSQK